jgi:hypothetical protein
MDSGCFYYNTVKECLGDQFEAKCINKEDKNNFEIAIINGKLKKFKMSIQKVQKSDLEDKWSDNIVKINDNTYSSGDFNGRDFIENWCKLRFSNGNYYISNDKRCRDGYLENEKGVTTKVLERYYNIVNKYFELEKLRKLLKTLDISCGL